MRKKSSFFLPKPALVEKPKSRSRPHQEPRASPVQIPSSVVHHAPAGVEKDDLGDACARVAQRGAAVGSSQGGGVQQEGVDDRQQDGQDVRGEILSSSCNKYNLGQIF